MAKKSIKLVSTTKTTKKKWDLKQTNKITEAIR